MAPARDPDFLVIRRALRLLGQAEPERFVEQVRSLGFALEAQASRGDLAPRLQAEARRVARKLLESYPFEQAFQ